MPLFLTTFKTELTLSNYFGNLVVNAIPEETLYRLPVLLASRAIDSNPEFFNRPLIKVDRVGNLTRGQALKIVLIFLSSIAWTYGHSANISPRLAIGFFVSSLAYHHSLLSPNKGFWKTVAAHILHNLASDFSKKITLNLRSKRLTHVVLSHDQLPQMTGKPLILK